MTKLTASNREEILRNAIADTFDKQRAEMRAREEALFDRVYDHAVPQITRDLLEQVPSEFLQKTNVFMVNAAGWQVRFELSKTRPTRWGWGGISVTDLDLSEEVRALSAEKETMNERHREGQLALSSLLSKATTFERLKASWPEGKDYWEPVWTRETSKQLPAIDVATVNKALGLPKEAA